MTSKSSCNLIVDRDNHGIIPHFLNVSLSELIRCAVANSSHPGNG